ncbi:hypothetical protein JNUCC0626_20205 [Lentzea sp. JNUCC 0626]|uniref:hypothetical protein n=1 Tax=Lentzea sp. JNUCC 0626 TaxID=3367513 RepID=UPI0037483537
MEHLVKLVPELGWEVWVLAGALLALLCLAIAHHFERVKRFRRSSERVRRRVERADARCATKVRNRLHEARRGDFRVLYWRRDPMSLACLVKSHRAGGVHRKRARRGRHTKVEVTV